LHQYKGEFNWYPSVVATSARTTAAHSPAITAAYIYGGTFDASKMLETLTTAPTITTLYQYPNAKINIDNGYANFIITTYKHRGGVITTGAGQALTLS